MKKRIIYIPGLGDYYDTIRRVGLVTWRRSDHRVVLVPMRWSDPTETFEQKLARLQSVIEEDETPVVLVGESAGGAMAIVATDRCRNRVVTTLTLCGKNQGSSNVDPRLFRRNPAFADVMKHSDRLVRGIDKATKEKMMTVYSSLDLTVKPKDTLITGVTSYDLRTSGHLLSILLALYVRSSLMHRLIRSVQQISGA